MSDPRRFRLADLILLLLILATAAGARVGYLVTYADSGNNSGPIRVQDAPATLALPADTVLNGQKPANELAALIHNVQESRWFGSLAPFAGQEEQTAHAAPGYPWLLGELQRLLPTDLGPADRFIRWLQCVLGTLTAGLYFLIGRWTFPGRVVGLLSGLFAALYPFWIFNTPAISDGVLTTFLLAVCLALATRASRLDGALTCLLLGLALAGLALVRAALLPFSLVVLLWMLRRSRRTAGGWQFGLLAVLGFVIGLAPWLVRNVQVFGDIYPIVDSTYVDLWMGNNPQATGGPLSETALWAALPAHVQERLEDSTLSQPARYRLLGQPVVDEIQRDPGAAVERRLWAGLYFFFGEEWFTHKQFFQSVGTGSEGVTTGSPFPAMLSGALLTILILGVLGWRWTYAWRTEAQPLALAVLWVPLPYLLSHAEALSGPRLPLDGVFLCYSAFVLASLVPGGARSLLRPRRARD